MKTTNFFGKFCIIATCLLLVSALTVSAAARKATLYVATGTSGTTGMLYTINPATGAVIKTIGLLNDAAGNNYPMAGLAYDPFTKILYGATANAPVNPNTLVIVDPATALVTVIGACGQVLTDLTVDPTTGLMHALSGFNQKFFTVDTTTGQAVQTGSTDIGFANGGGLSATRTGELFGVSNFTFYSFNKTTGIATILGLTNLTNLVKAADVDPSSGVFYGLEGGGGLIDNKHQRWLDTFDTFLGLGIRGPLIPIDDLDAIAFIPARTR